MKHWIEFLPNKTHETKRLGKIVTSIEFEKQQKEIELQNLEETLSLLQTDIFNKLKKYYSSSEVMMLEVIKAKKAADKWNTTPTTELQNPNLKK